MGEFDISGDLLRALKSFEELWRVLSFFKLVRAFDSLGEHLLFFERFVVLWRALNRLGGIETALEIFVTLWRPLVRCGNFWRALESFGEHKKIQNLFESV